MIFITQHICNPLQSRQLLYSLLSHLPHWLFPAHPAQSSHATDQTGTDLASCFELKKKKIHPNEMAKMIVHKIIQLRRDLRRSLVQAPQGRAALGSDRAVQGFIQLGPGNLWGWNTASLATCCTFFPTQKGFISSPRQSGHSSINLLGFLVELGCFGSDSGFEGIDLQQLSHEGSVKKCPGSLSTSSTCFYNCLAALQHS